MPAIIPTAEQPHLPRSPSPKSSPSWRGLLGCLPASWTLGMTGSRLGGEVNAEYCRDAEVSCEGAFGAGERVFTAQPQVPRLRSGRGLVVGQVDLGGAGIVHR
jgi:hypothetical protein